MKAIPMDGALVGERLYSMRPGKRQDRLSIVGALCDGKFFAPMVYEGYCTAKVIETWLEKCLLPEVEAGQVIIMDNAPFPNSRKVRELIEKAGCELLFLPTYSPDLNPIDPSTSRQLSLSKFRVKHWWHKVKTAIRKELPKHDFNIHQAADSAFQYL